MSVCCSPNTVNLAENCYYWCELPANNTDDSSFSHCLITNGMAMEIVGFHLGGASGRNRSGLAWTALWGFLLTSFLSLY